MSRFTLRGSTQARRRFLRSKWPVVPLALVAVHEEEGVTSGTLLSATMLLIFDTFVDVDADDEFVLIG